MQRITPFIPGPLRNAGRRGLLLGESTVFHGILSEMLNEPDSAKSQRAMAAMLQMKKIDIDALRRAFAG